MSTDSDHHEKVLQIGVNGRERLIKSDRVTYDEVVALAGYPSAAEGTEYIVTYKHAVSPKHEGDLITGEHVIVKDGTDFVVEPGNRS
jgi:Multiubiquitin